MGTDITDTKYEVAKLMTMGGITYRPGDSIDISHLSDYKVGQLLNQRWIRPVANQ